MNITSRNFLTIAAIAAITTGTMDSCKPKGAGAAVSGDAAAKV